MRFSSAFKGLMLQNGSLQNDTRQAVLCVSANLIQGGPKVGIQYIITVYLLLAQPVHVYIYIRSMDPQVNQNVNSIWKISHK